ncbi:MAG: DUF488 domain-containing protein [Planctomycetota bacterium]|nr:DUF488 domain-containing protein [Planctomycetota bacterium]
MLTRQKIILSLLSRADGPLPPTIFVKLVFLLRQETALAGHTGFYDFVPYNFGPFSFTLYRDLNDLRRNGYVEARQNMVALRDRTRDLVGKETATLPPSVTAAVSDIIRRYGKMGQQDLVRDVYVRYPWYASRSELTDLRRGRIPPAEDVPPAVYTIGYEGRSAESFLNLLLKEGIRAVIDVRANPVSRKYGFSKARLGKFCKKLGIRYRPAPVLGVPDNWRAGLDGLESYRRLLDRYERVVLPARRAEVLAVGDAMRRTPSVLLCMEKDPRLCHRGRLAAALAAETGLKVIHL